MAKRKSPIGGLYEFKIANRLVYGLCTHEKTAKIWVNMGQFVRFFEGVESERPADLTAVLARPVLFSGFTDISGQVRLKNAVRVLDADPIPAALQPAPRLRVEGLGGQDDMFLVEGLELDGPFIPVDDPYGEEDLAEAPTTEIFSIDGILARYRFGISQRRRYDIAVKRDKVDEVKDAIF